MKPFERCADTLVEAAESLRTRATTSRALVERCLAAIEKREAAVRAWVFVDAEYARRCAEECDAEIAAGRYRGPLHGIPVAIKDIFDVQGWPTAAGFEPWKNRLASADAPLVRQLRDAGAVFLGKTVTTQFASFDPSITRNPWNAERTPGGSSSGSAAALACGMCYAALASQTGGSITRPASYCGVAGFKPSYGRLPLEGILPLAPSMDHPGAMARSIGDLQLVMRVLDRSEVKPPSAAFRIGRLRGHFETLASPEARESMDAAVEALRGAGVQVIEVDLPASFAGVIQSHRTIMAVEAAAWHDQRLREQPEHYGPWIRELLAEGLAARAVDYRRAREHQSLLSQEMPACFAGAEVLLAPATTTPAPNRDTTGDPAFNSPWSFTGLPVASFPVAWTADGLPLAIQLIGRMDADAELLGMAARCEELV
jgi:aspartyl-tRNA(Asn)/glutamyl-tRNA(Gln) amidotransferase subunit A